MRTDDAASVIGQGRRSKYESVFISPFLLLNREHPISESNAACVKIPRDHLTQEFFPSKNASAGSGLCG